MDLKEQDILGESAARHWYYRSKARAVERMLPQPFNRRIMDVGAGSGFFSRHLAERGLIDDALCIDTGYERDRDDRVGNATIHFRTHPEAADADVALFMDVLEHVPDDVGLLSAYRPLLPPTARVIITVPAFQFLWSGHDVFLEHYRRYTRQSLRTTVARAGYRLVRSHYFYGLVLPAAMTTRLLARERMAPRSAVQRHGRVANTILTAACSLELPLMRFNHLAGLSVVAVCTPA
jgi:2-polyprenyl-3-methyl-5-hydroxy-6-metoxy-1,4-benzoquinol methylase